MSFRDRFHSGQLLAERILKLKDELTDPIVLALPRGGIEVGYQISQKMGCPLSVFIVRKLGAPGNPEFAIGAVTETGKVLESEYCKEYGKFFQKIREEEEKRILHQKQVFRQGKELESVEGRSVILCDDGVATGLTFKAAILGVKEMSPREVIAAVPVAPYDVAMEISSLVDRGIFLETPTFFVAVSQFYQSFYDKEDSFYRSLLGIEKEG